LIDTLADKVEGVRVWSAHALGDIDAADSAVSSALIRSLRDPSPDVRRVILAVLIRLGPQASGASTALKDLLQDADAGIRAQTCIAYRQIGPYGKAGIPALIGRLGDPDADVRGKAAEALMKIGPDGVADLTRALRERDPNVRRAAAEVLGSFGAESKGSSTDLADAAKDPDAGVQKAAAEAIKKIQNDNGDQPAVRGTTFIEAPAVVSARTAGYKWAKFGLYIPWGPYSAAARARPGQRAEDVLENEKILPTDYARLCSKLSAQKFNAEEWAKLANEAGVRYIVLTAKQQDGFCLWNSRLTDYTAVRMAGARRDLVGELAAACGKAQVKFCAYYSMRDLHHPDYRDNFPKYVEYMHGQVKELLDSYPLWGVWFDGETEHTRDEWHSDDLLTMIRRTKPAAFINDRLGRDTRGQMTGIDFYTQEPDIAPAALRLQGRPTAWEFTQTVGDSASYTESPEPLKSGERIILDLVDVVSKGGNFLLSIGPRGDGSIPEALQERLRVVGVWMKSNGDAIYDTERGPFNGPLPAGKVSAKGNRLYVYLEEYPRDGIIALPGLKTKVREAWVVDGKRELTVRENGIQAPAMIEGSPVTVVAIELEGPPEVAR
jgi:alpha-L-fucosidase